MGLARVEPASRLIIKSEKRGKNRHVRLTGRARARGRRRHYPLDVRPGLLIKESGATAAAAAASLLSLCLLFSWSSYIQRRHSIQLRGTPPDQSDAESSSKRIGEGRKKRCPAAGRAHVVRVHNDMKEEREKREGPFPSDLAVLRIFSPRD